MRTTLASSATIFSEVDRRIPNVLSFVPMKACVEVEKRRAKIASFIIVAVLSEEDGDCCVVGGASEQT